MKKVLLIAIIIPVILVGAIYAFAKMGVEKSGAVSCTTEPQTCSDGSIVYRKAPTCEFATCPNQVLPTPAEPEPTPGQKVTQVGFGQTFTDNDIRIAPISLVGDSRCPKDVNCIQAGTVTILVQFKKEGETKEVTIHLGESIEFGGKHIQFSSVNPQKYSKVVIAPGEYRFEFLVTAGN